MIELHALATDVAVKTNGPALAGATSGDFTQTLANFLDARGGEAAIVPDAGSPAERQALADDGKDLPGGGALPADAASAWLAVYVPMDATPLAMTLKTPPGLGRGDHGTAPAVAAATNVAAPASASGGTPPPFARATGEIHPPAPASNLVSASQSPIRIGQPAAPRLVSPDCGAPPLNSPAVSRIVPAAAGGAAPIALSIAPSAAPAMTIRTPSVARPAGTSAYAAPAIPSPNALSRPDMALPAPDEISVSGSAAAPATRPNHFETHAALALPGTASDPQTHAATPGMRSPPPAARPNRFETHAALALPGTASAPRTHTATPGMRSPVPVAEAPFAVTGSASSVPTVSQPHETGIPVPPPGAPSAIPVLVTAAAPAVIGKTIPPPALALGAVSARPNDESRPEASSSSTFLAAGLGGASHTPIADAQRAPIDLRHDEGLQRMIDRIEVLRDDADARDTRIRLVPDALGAVDVTVRRQGESLQVHFSAQSHATAALIAEAQPRLTELAEARGIKLGQATIDSGGRGNDGQPQHHAPARQTRPAAPATRGETQSTDHRIA